MPRTHKDLINELKAEAENGGYGSFVGLAVGFDKTTEFVYPHDPQPEEKLLDLMKKGGEPIGFVAIIASRAGVKTEFGTKSDQISIKVRPLAEYANETWVNAYLNNLAGNVAKTFQARLG